MLFPLILPIFFLVFLFPHPIQCRLHWTSDASSMPSIFRPYHRNFPVRPFFNPNSRIFRWLNFAPEEEAIIFESGFIPFGGIGAEWQSEAKIDDIENVQSILAKLNWTEAEHQLADRLFERWQFEDLLNFFYAKLLEMPKETERNLAFSLMEKYSPPKSLVQALQAMTPEQKGHIQELVEASNGGRRRGRAGDLKKIAWGMVATLPDEDQDQANRFLKMANYFLHFW